ncbi:GDYXXLXY domain-containing protein [Campylobacter concisus]|uniref:GDYXXLXY domain-containing protein n=1 Tax=Campylobacter concisus TaxID=199 RepID=UPI0011E76BE4|nr:GDYXXLXY domain-containing protein [Campylobacter concisus]
MKIKVLIVAVVFQISLIGIMLGYALMPLYFGQEVRVRVSLYDPRDLFRGNYVDLNYEFSNFHSRNFDENDEDDRYIDQYDERVRDGARVYAVLKPDVNGTYSFAKFSISKPDNGVFLAGRYDGYSLVKYGIEQFYMSPDSAANTEDEMREEDVDAYAILMVMDNGKARLKDLIIQKNAQKNSKKLLGGENFDKLDDVRQKE